MILENEISDRAHYTLVSIPGVELGYASEYDPQRQYTGLYRNGAELSEAETAAELNALEGELETARAELARVRARYASEDSRKCNQCSNDGRRYDLCDDCAARFLPARPAEWREELTRMERTIATLRSELATGHELAASILAPPVEGVAYWDSIMDSLRAWLRRAG